MDRRPVEELLKFPADLYISKAHRNCKDAGEIAARRRHGRHLPLYDHQVRHCPLCALAVPHDSLRRVPGQSTRRSTPVTGRRRRVLRGAGSASGGFTPERTGRPVESSPSGREPARTLASSVL